MDGGMSARVRPSANDLEMVEGYSDLVSSMISSSSGDSASSSSEESDPAAGMAVLYNDRGVGKEKRRFDGNVEVEDLSSSQRSMLLEALMRTKGKERHRGKKLPTRVRDADLVLEDARNRVGEVGLDCINALRMISADTVEKAQSGHPGMPMGMSPTAFVLWDRHLRFNPGNPNWLNRDRFILSTGHGSVLHYALLHLYGYDSVSIDDLKNFRQLHSTTPGHPENYVTAGVEVMTGALGQGIANAVGLALAEKFLAATYNRAGTPELVNHFTYCIVGDGCMMEGIASEACSLAAHWALGKLIVFYDDNQISIDGSTELAFTEDVAMRYRAYGWHVIEIVDGDNDVTAIDDAIIAAKMETERPSLIKVRTTIGYGAPTKAGTNRVHGAALGETELLSTRRALNWPHAPFEIPSEALRHTRRKVASGAELEAQWRRDLEECRTADPDHVARFESTVLRQEISDNCDAVLKEAALALGEKPMATRHTSQTMLNALAGEVPGLFGGAADLESSCMTRLKECGDFQREAETGRNVHFGVREHAMGAISNGLALYGGGIVPYCSTFLVFTDYMRGAIRTAALSRAGVIFVMTHDSVLLGEDGPTHQPVEHLASFRAMPDIHVLRPSDAVETAACYALATRRRNAPSMIVLSRQKSCGMPVGCFEGAQRGGYVISDGNRDGTLELILIATGSELALAETAAKTLRDEDRRNVRVVSMPCVEEFQAQDAAYRESVLPRRVPLTKRLVVEAASSFGWHRYALNFHCVDEFGISAPGAVVAEELNFTTEKVIEHARSILTCSYDS